MIAVKETDMSVLKHYVFNFLTHRHKRWSSSTRYHGRRHRGGGGDGGTGPSQTFQRLTLSLWALHGKNLLQMVLVPQSSRHDAALARYTKACFPRARWCSQLMFDKKLVLITSVNHACYQERRQFPSSLDTSCWRKKKTLNKGCWIFLVVQRGINFANAPAAPSADYPTREQIASVWRGSNQALTTCKLRSRH